jgi:hypothetical protein
MTLATDEIVEIEEEDLSKPEAEHKLKKDRTFYEFLDNFAGQSSVRCELFRDQPRMWAGKNTRGYVTTYDGTDLTIAEIQAAHGGGTFRLVIKTPTKSGRWVIRDQYTIEIQGDPIIAGLNPSPTEATASQEKTSMSDEAVKQAFEFARSATEKAESRNNGSDLEVLGGLMENFQKTQEHSNTQLLDFLKAQTNQPKDNAAEQVFELMKTNLQGEGSRLAALRDAHEAELRQKATFHEGQIERLQDRHDRDMQSAKDAALREIDGLKTANAAAIEAFKNGFEMRLEALKETVKRYEREIDQKNQELVELRARKEKGPLDALKEMAAIKTAMDEFSPSGGDDDEPKGLAAKALDALGPLAERFAMNLSAPAAAPEAPAQLPPGGEDDPIVEVKMSDGSTRQMPRSQLIHLQQMQARQQAEAEAAAAGPQMNLPPEQIQVAVTYMENAFNNQIDPEVFAQSARSSVPGEIIDFLKEHGVDPFIDIVAKLGPDSVLASVRGRTFVRKVAECLLPPSSEKAE